MATKTTKGSAKKATKVADFEPNKMGFAVATLSVITLVLLAVIVTF